MMKKLDLVLLHPPTVYAFRDRSILFGPISDIVPSTPIFEMYPLGFLSLASHLYHNNLDVRIINLAYRMMKEPAFRPEKLLKKLDAVAFGIDLHWLPHCHGAIEVARLVKKIKGDVPVIAGGLAATYFHEEIIEKYPSVDFVLRGDSTEAPLLLLLEKLKRKESLEEVPNLTWRKNGETVANPLSHVPSDLSDHAQDYDLLLRNAVFHRNVKNMIPFHDWLQYPITAVLTCKGCGHNCVFCGGSSFSYKRFYGRKETAFKPPEKIAWEMDGITKYTDAPAFFIGDPREGGEDYTDKLLELLGKRKINNHVTIELFKTADRSYFRKLSKALPNFNLEISPESHDPEVRRESGKNYNNAELEETIEQGLEAGCKKIDIFFTVGLPRQTPSSVLENIDYCGELLSVYGKDGRVFPFISPLAPFLDPGSPGFEMNDRFGYKILFSDLEDYRSSLTKPTWREMLNYETRWMSREEIVRTTYKAALKLNALKRKYALLDPHEAGRVEKRIHHSLELLSKPEMLEKGAETLPGSGPSSRRFSHNLSLSMGTICSGPEIKWPVGHKRRRIPVIIQAWMREALKNLLWKKKAPAG